MQVRTAQGPMEVRAVQEFGTTDPWALRLQRNSSPAGVTVTADKVLGLPTIVECMRLVSNSIAQLPIIVYDGTLGVGPQNRIQATSTWQSELFQKPNLNTTRFNLIADIVTGIEGYGNSFCQKIKTKIKGKTQVVELNVIDPDKVKIHKGEDGSKLFDVYISPRKVLRNLTVDDIIHFRGFNLDGQFSGLSVIQQFNAALGNVLATQEFSGRYFANDSTPGGYIELPADSNLDKIHLDEILEMWEERHGGLSNKSKTAILQGGATYQTVQISAESAQLILTQEYNVQDMARMMDVPVELLMPTRADVAKTEELLLRFMTFYLKPRIERISSTFNEDPDLFAGSPIFLDFDYKQLYVASLNDQSNYDLRSRQAGIETPNEIRARRGLPPAPDGDDLLKTPVGAGPNAAETGPDAGNDDVNASGKPSSSTN